MLNTLHDGPFSQMKEQGDIHVHHYQKGENPDDKKKREKQEKIDAEERAKHRKEILIEVAKGLAVILIAGGIGWFLYCY